VSDAPPSRPGLGIALVVGVGVSFATMDAIVKVVGVLLPVLVILWVRYAFQAASMGLWLAASPRGTFRAAHPQFQIVRGALLLATSALGWTGLQKLPVAEFTAINMLAPLLVTLFAAVALHERVSALRWALVAGGFAGALLVVRPGSGLYGAAALYPLAGACCYAGFQVLTSRYSALENPLTTHFYTGFVGTAILTPLLLASGIDLAAMAARLDAPTGMFLVVIGMLGTLGHLMLIVALGVAPAATLMPFLYAQIAVAAVAGWIAFGHVPDALAFAGMGIIAASGAASAWLNLRATWRTVSPVAADTIAE
jgi:drug/metabolite transporter (DMT)-like permease